MGKTFEVNSLGNLAKVCTVNIKFRNAGADNRGSLQVVGALRPQCIILSDFQHDGRLLRCERSFCQRFIIFSFFAHFFCTKMLYLESLRVAKLDFGVEALTFRACQGNLSHFSNRR